MGGFKMHRSEVSGVRPVAKTTRRKQYHNMPEALKCNFHSYATYAYLNVFVWNYDCISFAFCVFCSICLSILSFYNFCGLHCFFVVIYLINTHASYSNFAEKPSHFLSIVIKSRTNSQKYTTLSSVFCAINLGNNNWLRNVQNMSRNHKLWH